MKRVVTVLFSLLLLMSFVACSDDEDGGLDLGVIAKTELVLVHTGTFIQSDTNGNSFSHTINGFQMAKYQVTYELWYKIYSWATNSGYSFVYAGREGTDGTNGAAPTGDKYEPVMTINWRDAIVWCNAYSEAAGYAPVYYSDASYTTLLKNSRDGRFSNTVDTNAGSFDNPYVNWSTAVFV